MACNTKLATGFVTKLAFKNIQAGRGFRITRITNNDEERTMHRLFGAPLLKIKRTQLVAAALLVVACGLAAGVATAQSAAVQTPAPVATATSSARVWTSPVAGDVLRGAALYQTSCTACHAIDSNKVGPAHRGVLGRRVGSLPGYRYSDELARSRLRWTAQTLNLWLEDPEELVAGQRMGFQVDSAQERADLIAYLATLK